jgi:integrase
MQRGQVWKKSNGWWAIRYYDAAGHRHQETVGKRKEDAVTVLDERLRQARLGDLYQHRKQVTLSELVDLFLQQYQRPRQTRMRMQTELNRATKAFGDVPVRQLDSAEIAQWISRLRIAQTTRNQTIRSLRQVLRQGMAWGYLSANPADAERVRVPSGHRADVKPFQNWDELDAVADAIGGRYGPLVIFAAATGLRPEEWSALEWRDVDIAGRNLRVSRTYTRVGGFSDLGKTEAARRRVDLQRRAIDALEQLPRRLDGRRVFSTHQRERLVEVTYWAKHWFYPALELAQLDRRPPYHLRHTFAAFALAAGNDLHWLKEQMGHTSIRVTSDRYGHLVPRHRSDALDRLDAWSSTPAQREAGTRPFLV